MKRKKIADILATNVQRLLETHKTITSQEKLSARSGIGQSSISRIIRSETKTSVETISEIARAFGVPLQELLLPPEEYERQISLTARQQENRSLIFWPFPITVEQYLELQDIDRQIINRCTLGVYENHKKEKSKRRRKII